MSYKTTRDVLNRVINFHIGTKDLFILLAKKTENERSKILLEYRGKHQDQYIDMLTRYMEDASGKILNSWFQFEPDKDKLKVCEEKDIKLSMDVNDIIDLSLEMDNCLINFYEEMAGLADYNELKEIFLGLAKLVRKNEQILVRDAEKIKML